MHDFVDLEAQGVVTTFCASSEFVEASAAQARSLGYERIPAVFVPHPIQDRTDGEMRERADEALEALLAAVTAGATARRSG